VHATSSVWETDAIGPAQPRYLNAVVLVEWDGALLDGLLSALLEIEQGMGRVRRERWGPRTIDLDILLAEHVALATDRLTVPHPGLADRAFALAPLLEVWSEARHPTTLARYADLRVDRAGVVRTELALD
jgi:2-amino-4-hydroxy-6-hydroxymethyldihydropteridine diphosphokinase